MKSIPANLVFVSTAFVVTPIARAYVKPAIVRHLGIRRARAFPLLETLTPITVIALPAMETARIAPENAMDSMQRFVHTPWANHAAKRAWREIRNHRRNR